MSAKLVSDQQVKFFMRECGHYNQGRADRASFSERIARYYEIRSLAIAAN